MKILKADHLGMCFGVKDAIELAFRKNDEAPVTILGELVHNENVLRSLEEKGIAISKEIPGVQTRNVLITAHGASDKRIGDARTKGFHVEEATCPLVHFAHRQVMRLVTEGYHPVIIGRKGHVEVNGLTEDLDEVDIVLTEDEIWALKPRRRFGVTSQTTQPIQRVLALVEYLRKCFPESEVKFVDTVCRPTKERQFAAESLGRACDVVVVIGGKNSNNTHELAETCSKNGARVHHVQSADELCEEWFRPEDTVGITAGTSTPDVLIVGVESWLNRVGARLERHGAVLA